MHLRSIVLAGVAAVGLTAGGTMGAQAQDSGDGATTLSERITVTARKREESIQDVPSSATVLTGDDLDALAIFDTVDLIRNIPNAIIAYGGGPEYLNDVILRGAGAGRTGGAEPATGLYRNGIYVGSGNYGGRQFSRMDLFDVQRVETFRGPQGAVFGRNAVGGAINVISRRPGDEFGGFVRAAYNTFDRYELSGAMDIPLTEDFAVRASGFFMEQTDGFIEQTFRDEAGDQRNEYGARLTAQYAPGDLFEWTTFVEYYDSVAPSFADFVFRDGLDPFERPFNGPSEVEIERISVSSEFVTDLSFAELTLVGLYAEQEAEREDDLDWFLNIANGGLGFFAGETSDQERIGLEARLASPQDGRRLSWLAGADYLKLDEDLVTTIVTAGPAITPFSESFESVSVFGLVDYQLTDRLEVGAELRATYDDKSIEQPTREQSESFENYQPAVSAVYTLNDAVNLYARIGSAYRAGGFNRSFPAVVPGADQYDVESTIGYEAGFKSILFDDALRFNVGAFFMQTEDVQIVTRTPGQTATYVQNAGDANVYGVEIEVQGGHDLDLTGGRVEYNLGVAVSEGQYTEGEAVPFGAVVPVVIEDNTFPRLRDVSGNFTGTYIHPLFDTWSAFAVTNLQFEAGGFEDTFNADPLADFVIVDLRAGVRNDWLEISAVGKNITDRFYIVERSGGGQIYSNRPVVWGVEARLTY